jgi:hypothetical protein
MDLTNGSRRDVLAPHKKRGARARQTTSTVLAFWVMLEGDARGLPLTVFLPDGKEAIALFSGEEEARMFCYLCGEERGANWRVREISADEVLWLLYRAGQSIRRLALDPFPEVVPGGGSLKTSTLSMERFARCFARPVPERAGGGPPWR